MLRAALEVAMEAEGSIRVLECSRRFQSVTVNRGWESIAISEINSHGS